MKAEKMEKKINQFIRNISDTHMAVVLSPINYVVVSLQILFMRLFWFLTGKRKPNQKEVQLVKEQVTFIYKSFERQKMAKQHQRAAPIKITHSEKEKIKGIEKYEGWTNN